jgi:hypothetical protein
LGLTAANSIVLLYHAVVVHIGLPMIEEACSRNLTGEKVIHIQSQVAGMEAVADIPVPWGKMVMGVRTGFPGAVVCENSVFYIHDVHPEWEAGVVHIRLAVYEGACIQFRHVELLIAMVGYILIVCVERAEGVAHIHLLAYEGVRIQFRHVELLIAMVGYILIVCVERAEGVAHIHLSAYEGVRNQFPHIVVLVAAVVCIPIVYVERQKVVAHIHPLACRGACMHLLYE